MKAVYSNIRQIAADGTSSTNLERNMYFAVNDQFVREANPPISKAENFTETQKRQEGNRGDELSEDCIIVQLPSSDKGLKKKAITENKINIEALKEGDRSELKVFTDYYANYIYNMVFSFVLNKEDTEEIVQDSLLAALQNLHRFRNEANLSTWIYRIAMNKAKDLIKYRNRKKRKKDENLFIASNRVERFHPGIALESKEEIKAINDAINLLPENQKTAIILAKFDHKSFAEISIILKNTPKAVEGLVSRAKANIKKYLKTKQNG